MAANGKAAAGAGLLMLVLAVETQSVWLQVVGCAMAGLLGVSLFVVVRTPRITVEVTAPREATVGMAFPVTLTVSNVGRRQCGGLRVLSVPADNPDLMPSLASVYVDPIPPGERRTATISRTSVSRGAAHAFVTKVEEFAPFGFFSVRCTIADDRALHVGPAPAPPIELLRVAGDQPDHNGPMGAGLEVRGIREWRPGDATRHVHWRSTARIGRLTVLEHGEPGIGALGVMVAGRPGEPRLEAGVAVAAATASCAAADGITVIVAFEGNAGGYLETVTQLSWCTVFSHVGFTQLPSPATVSLLMEALGAGGLVMLVTSPDVPPGFRSYVEQAAAASGIRVFDVADESRGGAA